MQAGYPRTDDLNGYRQEGFGPMDRTVTANGRRASTARGYLDHARERPNLIIVTHATTDRILFGGKRANGVAYLHGHASITAYARREVLLCGGAIASPQILQRSGVGPETAYHPSCSCAMGYDEMAVVDNEGRVHGVEGLRVVDASIMPRITTGNLNAPTIMLAEKIADRIRGRAALPRVDVPYFVANGAAARGMSARCDTGKADAGARRLTTWEPWDLPQREVKRRAAY